MNEPSIGNSAPVAASIAKVEFWRRIASGQHRDGKKRCEQPVGVTQFEIDRAPQNHANSLFRATAAIDCVS
jgi:hypothetical protein